MLLSLKNETDKILSHDNMMLCEGNLTGRDLFNSMITIIKNKSRR